MKEINKFLSGFLAVLLLLSAMSVNAFAAEGSGGKTTLTTTVPWAVTFYANGHGTVPAVQRVISGNPAAEPTAPIASGWTFGGWYKDSACTETQKYDFNTPVTANLDLYAKWTQNVGDLIVTKRVTGNAGSSNKEFSFTVTLSDTMISGTYGDMKFVNGVASFTLKDGSSKKAVGLPSGVHYIVTEKDYKPDGYVTTKNGDEGIIVSDDELTATFINTKNTDPSPYDYKFSFRKKWSGGKEDSINWTLYKPDGTIAHKGFNKKIISETEWYYEAWFEGPVDYYIVEDVPEGYSVHYENTGAHADVTDRCYNGGTIINYKVPKTGDNSNLTVWFGVLGVSLLGLIVTITINGKKRREPMHEKNK